MSDLTSIEKIRLEKLFQMGSGYVLDFTNNSLREFILDNTNKDIYSETYSFKGDSKANRLRAFWSCESNYTVAKVIRMLIDYCYATSENWYKPLDTDLCDECLEIAIRLEQNTISDGIDDILKPETDDKDFSLLAKTIRDSLEKNEPEAALDRLHTYVVKYVRRLCDKHGISYDNNKPLHGYYGEYVKYLKQNSCIESDITEKILKYAISIMDAFNDVRNNKSFAHDNNLLNYDESLLVFKNVASIIGFIESIERKIEKQKEDELKSITDGIDFDNLPF